MRVGTYGGPRGAISDVTGNCFANNGGDAVNLEGKLHAIAVTYNRDLQSGSFFVGAGDRIVVANNRGTVSCSEFFAHHKWGIIASSCLVLRSRRPRHVWKLHALEPGDLGCACVWQDGR